MDQRKRATPSSPQQRLCQENLPMSINIDDAPNRLESLASRIIAIRDSL